MAIAGRALLVSIAFAGLLVACDGATPVRIHLENRTDTDIELLVDDVMLGTYPAGAIGEATVPNLGGAPFVVTVRSGTGTTFIERPVNAEQWAIASKGGLATAEEVGLPCGVIRLVIGTLPADEVPAPAASVKSGPCP